MKNTALSAIIDSEITEEMIAALAREKLDLVEPGEQVFVDISK
jgi:cell division protein FtsB